MANYLITGASRGLGLKICETLLKKGHSIIAVARKANENIDFLSSKYPGSVHFIPYDLENIDQIKEVIFQPILDQKIVIDGLVNNAAIAYEDLITNAKKDELIKMINVNQLAPILLTKYVIRNMILHQTKGSIVHISSVCVHTGYKGLSMYAATKGALEAFSKNCAREWGKVGIRSNCIAAGFMETEMTSVLTDEQKSKIYGRACLQAPTEIESVAETVNFLLSPEAISITAQVFHVDAGTH